MNKLGKGVFWTALAIGIIVGVLRGVAFKPWTLPDNLKLAASIAPTLDNKDTVLLLTRGKRGFGDLVRCQDPDDPAQYTIGRIVGVEGDEIDVKKGRMLYVNGKRYDPTQACPAKKYSMLHPNTEAEIELQCGVVDMGGGWHYRAQTKTNRAPSDFHAVVGEGMVFLLSDNIDFHDDSRDFGTLERATCTEKIIFRLWSEAGWSDEENRLTFIH